MSNNIISGLNVVHALQTAPIASTGVNNTNTLIIYLMEANHILSYVPGRSINAISTFVQGKGYILISSQAMDLHEYLGPPFPAGQGILLEDGGSIPLE